MQRIWLGVALLVHTVIAGTYAWRTPAWEGPDENDHAYYASFLRATGHQPTILRSSATTGRSHWEEASLGHHPPLYYAALGQIGAMVGSGDYTPYWSPVPMRPPGAALQWQHGYDERAPVSAEISVLRWQRGFSTLLGALSIALTFALARVLYPTRPGVPACAALLLACLPQWSWMHGVLDNGNLATTLAAATVLLLAQAVRRRALGVGRGAVLGLLLGAALLTKLTALFLLPLAALVFGGAALAWRERRRSVLSGGALAALLAAAISGAWFWRNNSIYGDPLALAPHAVAYASNRLPAELRASYLGGDFIWRTLHTTFAGIGWSLRPAPWWAEAAGAAVVLAGLLGWLWRGRALCREGGLPLAVGLASLGLTLAGLVQFNLTFIQPQGRYLFPAIGVVAIVVAAGLAALPRPRGPAVPAVAAAVCVVLALLLQHGVFLPMLAPSSPPDACYASYYAGLHTVGAPAQRTVQARSPDADAVLDAAPTFTWHDPDAPADATYSVQIWFASGIAFATWESAGLKIGRSEWTMPDGYWAALPAGEALRWRVRRVANRAHGEAALTQPESELRAFVRRR